MTPLIAEIMREIGDPLEIGDAAASARGIPPLRTSVPAFPCFGGVAAVLSPAMCKDASGAKQLDGMSPLVELIFSEANFELVAELPEGESAVLVIKPLENALYQVWQVRGPPVLSPFGARQVMSARAIAFGIAMIIQMSLFEHPGRSIARERAMVIAGLCRSEAQRELGVLAAQVYVDRSE
jgi:hypothetical protein